MHLSSAPLKCATVAEICNSGTCRCCSLVDDIMGVLNLVDLAQFINHSTFKADPLVRVQLCWAAILQYEIPPPSLALCPVRQHTGEQAAQPDVSSFPLAAAMAHDLRWEI